MDGGQGCVDVVQVNLASGLKFVEVIQEVECERGAWLFQRCGKPSYMEELDTRWSLLSRFPTVAVVNANSGNTRNIEEGEIHGRGRLPTCFTNMMTELIHSAQSEQCGCSKKIAHPLLENTDQVKGGRVQDSGSPEYCATDHIGGPLRCNAGKVCT